MEKYEISQITRSTDAGMYHSELRKLIALTLKSPVDSKIDEIFDSIDGQDIQVFLGWETEQVVGLLIVKQMIDGEFEILNIAVNPTHQRQGIGRLLFNHHLQTYPNSILMTKADQQNVLFFHSLGFRVQKNTGQDTLCYSCLYDHTFWNPSPLEPIIHDLQYAGLYCWVAGGWALDLHHGKQTRPHTDTDILILRRDQHRAKQIFADWEIFHTHAPGLRYWRDDGYLEHIPNLWLRRDQTSPWSFELMFQDVEQDQWVYRRNRQIRGTLSEMGLVTDEGIPYLRPEIQLLYKGGSSAPRQKDRDDMKRMLPLLSEAAKLWLISAFEVTHPNGHKWIPHIQASL